MPFFTTKPENLSERILHATPSGRNNWGVVGSETVGWTVVPFMIVEIHKYLRVDPLAYLRAARLELYLRGERWSADRLRDWLPHRRPLARDAPNTSASAR